MQPRDLYKIAELADCYSGNLTSRTPLNAEVLSVRPHRVCIDAAEYVGSVKLHDTLCDAVESGLLPQTLVNSQIIIPRLLRRGNIDCGAFLRHMDRDYCVHFADATRSGHAHRFSRAYGRAIAAIVMEGWWSGPYFAMSVGSLIEAQPTCIANGRAH